MKNYKENIAATLKTNKQPRKTKFGYNYDGDILLNNN